MAYATGITRYAKKKELERLATFINAAANVKMAIFTGNTHTSLDANNASAENLADITATQLSSSGTGYTAGGFVLDEAVVVASGNNYQLQFSAVGSAAGQMVTGSGTISAGNYTGVMYYAAAPNKIVAIFPVSISTGSSGGAMTFTVPANAITL